MLENSEYRESEIVQWVKAVATKPDNQNQSLGSTWLEVRAYSHRLTSSLHMSSLVCRWAGMLTHKHTHMHTHTELNTIFKEKKLRMSRLPRPARKTQHRNSSCKQLHAALYIRMHSASNVSQIHQWLISRWSLAIILHAFFTQHLMLKAETFEYWWLTCHSFEASVGMLFGRNLTAILL